MAYERCYCCKQRMSALEMKPRYRSYLDRVCTLCAECLQATAHTGVGFVDTVRALRWESGFVAGRLFVRAFHAMLKAVRG